MKIFTITDQVTLTLPGKDGNITRYFPESEVRVRPVTSGFFYFHATHIVPINSSLDLTMSYLVWQLIRFLLSFLGNSIMAFMTLQPFHHIGQSARAIPLNLLLLLLVWLEGLQLRLLRATQMVHRPPPSTSRLLLLPPELRLKIWAMLLEDMVDVEDVKYVHVRDLGPRLYRYSDRLCLYMDLNPEYLTIWVLQDNFHRSRLQWPPVFMQSCRHIYLEAGHEFRHNLCSNKTFKFYESRALVSWIRNLSVAQKRAVGDILMIMSNDEFNNLGIAPAMHQLSGLRKLELRFYTDEKDVSMYTSDVRAHIVWQFVRSVKVSEVLLVSLTEVHAPANFNWIRYRWPAYEQAEFALAVEARIRRPLSAVQYWVPVGTGNEARFVLRVKRPLKRIEPW